jgi:hypothetical protein
MAVSIPTKATKHRKSLLVTRYLIGNRNGKQEGYGIKTNTNSISPKQQQIAHKVEMGKHQKLAQDTNK